MKGENKMFKLYQLKPEGSDCTAPYGVKLNGEYTVESFIHDVLLDRREWGFIGIRDGHSTFGNPCCEYSNGEIKSSSMTEEFSKMKVVSATASGGWSRMDYLLVVEPMYGDFVLITDHFGIRHELVDGVANFTVYHALGGKPTAMFRTKAGAINECKYLERMLAEECEKWTKSE